MADGLAVPNTEYCVKAAFIPAYIMCNSVGMYHFARITAANVGYVPERPNVSLRGLMLTGIRSSK